MLLNSSVAHYATAFFALASPKPQEPDIPSVTSFDKVHFWRGLGLDFESDLLTFLHRDLPKILFVIILTAVLLRILTFFTNKLRRFADKSLETPARAAQLKTLASVVRAAGFGILIFHAVVEILEIFDVNVTPLLASAGVAGVAIGFGAQTIVKDVINGMLMLVENQLNVGDLVSAAGLTGFVEEISLRKITLRDGDTGAHYIIPNSQITTLTNKTRDLAKVIVRIPVDNSEDPVRVIALLTRIANEVAAEPQFAEVLRQPPEVWGVDSVDASSMVFPVAFVTNPQKQWALSREFRKRVLIELKQAGIELSGTSRIVQISGSGAATAVPATAPPTAPATQSPEAASSQLDQTAGTKP